MRRLLTATAAALVLLLGAAACGDDDGDAGPTTSSTTSTSTTSTTGGDATTTETTEPTTTTDDEAPPELLPDSELPGEPLDLYPYESAQLGVVAVAADDELNVRAGPGVDYDVVTALDPLAEGITATGRNRTLEGGSAWGEITAGGITGWANLTFLSHLGATRDVTSEVATERAETLRALAEAVAAERGSDEPAPTVTVVAGPTVGDLGEITVDVTGYPDDAQLGERLHVFAEADPGGEGFLLRTVESTALCRRGTTDDGLCL